METTMVQKSFAGRTTNSFVNYLMGNNATVPVVGEGATVLSWTDRKAYEVMEVSNCGKRAVIQQYHAKRIDANGMSEMQEYEYKELNGYNEVIVWKWGAWRKESTVIEFEDAFYAEYESEPFSWDRYNEWIKPLFGETNHLQFVEGKTKRRKEYGAINIIFGVKQQYHDYSF